MAFATLFGRKYEKYQRFVVNTLTKKFSQVPKFDSVVTTTINNSLGDLLKSVFVFIELPELDSGTYKDNTQYEIIKSATIESEGKEIDRCTGEWIKIYNKMNKKRMRHTNKLHVPLGFWFCNYFEGLPISRLKDIKISVSLSSFDDLILDDEYSIEIDEDFPMYNVGETITQRPTGTGIVTRVTNKVIYFKKNGRDSFFSNGFNIVGQDTNFIARACSNENKRMEIRKKEIVNCHLILDYIVLSENERQSLARPFSIITPRVVISKTRVTGTKGTVLIPFTDPCRVILWTSRNRLGEDTMTKAAVYFGDIQRVTYRDISYYKIIQPYRTRLWSKDIAMYSFCLYPFASQPSGTANLGMVRDPKVLITFSDAGEKTITLYALVNKILKIN